MRTRDILNSASFRLGLIQATAFAVAFSLLITYVSSELSSWLNHQLDQDIRDDLNALAEEANSRGLDAAAESIRRLLSDPDSSGQFYLLIDHDGRRLAGNAPTLPDRTGWAEMPLSKKVNHSGRPKDREHYLRGRAQHVQGGAILFVGRDMWPAGQMRETVIHGIGIVFIFTVALVLGLSLLTGLSVLSRIEAIIKASREIMAGDLDRRIPVGRSKNELRLADQLNAMLDRISQLMGDVRQVTTDIAHDLRTPLGRVRQSLETVRLKGKSIKDYERAVDTAIGQTDGLLSTFQAMLQIAQIDSGTRRSRFTPVDLRELLIRLVDLYTPVAEDRNQVLLSYLFPKIMVRGDRELLQQMFANLIENALTHTPPGTRIELGLVHEESGIVLTVADNGPGIPLTLRGQVFKPFVRVDEDRSTPGTGLGLAIVAAVARLHDIQIELEGNEPGLRVRLIFKAGAHLTACDHTEAPTPGVKVA